MNLKLSKIEISLKDKITWKDIIGYEKSLKESILTDESFLTLLFIIDNIIEYINVDDKVVKDKLQIEDYLLNPEYTTLKDLDTINSDIGDYIKKKIS